MNNANDQRSRAQAALRSTAVVYGGAGFLSALLLPVGMQPLLVAWLIAGNLAMSRFGIAPPDLPTSSLRYWLEHLKMAMAWPLLWYWVRRRHARVTRRDPWRAMR